MKFFYQVITALVFITFVVGIEACKDPCETTYCENGGGCYDGECECPEGLIGEHCEERTCVGVNCLNGGECLDGFCDCPERYTGERCQIDRCPGFECENGTYIYNAYQDNCSCDCDQGWWGANCDETYRDEFIGYYSMEAYCNGVSGTTYYSMNITADTGSYQNILLNNFNNMGISLKGKAPSSNYMTIPTQSFTINGQVHTFSGSATLSGSYTKHLNVNFTHTSDGWTKTCHTSGDKY